MPSLHTVFAWATPVDIEALGANLDAYIHLLPTISMLRLCHRFGGKGTAISRLPVELLSHIEDILIETKREEARMQWREDYLCYRQECSTLSHFSEEEQDDLRDDLRADLEAAVDDEVDDEELSEYLAECGGSDQIHMDNMSSWVSRVAGLTGQKAAFFEKHFGLCLWTSPVRLSRAAWNYDHCVSEATLAYLRLPNAPSTKHTADFCEYDYDTGYLPYIDTGCAMDVSKYLAQPKDTKARFNRAMRILCLKPYEHDSQKSAVFCPPKAQEDEVKDAEEGKEGKQGKEGWPRLMVLANTMGDGRW